jgi:hypothetical protein
MAAREWLSVRRAREHLAIPSIACQLYVPPIATHGLASAPRVSALADEV